MTIPKKNVSVVRRMPFASILASALIASATSPVFAAPGDTLEPVRPRETTLIDSPAGTGLSYLSIPGSTFHRLDGNTSYSYPGNGCIAKTGGTDSRFVHKVILPQGAIVRYLRLYYYDVSSSDVAAFFTVYDGAGNFNELTSVSSTSGSAGFGSALSPVIDFTVDRFSSAINVLVNLSSQNNETLQFCGVRLAFEPPVTDRIFANGFDLPPL